MSEQGHRSSTLAVSPPELTVRTCTRCGNHYVWPKESRRNGGECPRCQPLIPGLEHTPP